MMSNKTHSSTIGLSQTQKMSYISKKETLFDNLIWLTTNEAAEYLRTTPNNVRVMICRGRLKPYKLGNRNRFKRSELDDLIESSKKKDSYGHHF